MNNKEFSEQLQLRIQQMVSIELNEKIKALTAKNSKLEETLKAQTDRMESLEEQISQSQESFMNSTTSLTSARENVWMSEMTKNYESSMDKIESFRQILGQEIKDKAAKVLEENERTRRELDEVDSRVEIKLNRLETQLRETQLNEMNVLEKETRNYEEILQKIEQE